MTEAAGPRFNHSLMETDKRFKLLLAVSPQLIEQMNSVAKALNYNRSELLRELLRRYLPEFQKQILANRELDASVSAGLVSQPE